MKAGSFICYVLCLFVSLSSISQNTVQSPENPVSLNKYYFKSYFTDSWDIVTAPVKWKKRQWVQAVMITGTWLAVYSQDQEINRFFQRNRSTTTDNISKYFLDPLGYGLYTVPAFGAIYVYGLISKNGKAETLALNGIKVFIISAGFAQGIKQISHRHRPLQDAIPDPANWDGPFSDIRYTSFPSGHTTTAFATAAFLSSAFEEKEWIQYVSYGLASLVGLSRLNDNEHWASDVFAGAILGHLIGKSIAGIYPAKGNSGLSLTASPNSLTIVYRMK